MKNFEVLLATIILAAVKLREESYDKTKNDYTLDLLSACETAAEENEHIALGYPVYLMLDDWNEATSWAESVLDPTGTVLPSSVNCQHGVLYPVCSDDKDADDVPIESDAESEEIECPLCAAFFEKLNTRSCVGVETKEHLDEE